jgi:iron-sulfur cluster assembly protein
MLFVSETASTKIKQIMNEQNMTPGHFVIKSDDQSFEDKGVKLVTDLRSFLYVCNTTLEYSDGLNGKGFEFKNPNATRTCACGESFAV